MIKLKTLFHQIPDDFLQIILNFLKSKGFDTSYQTSEDINSLYNLIQKESFSVVISYFDSSKDKFSYREILEITKKALPLILVSDNFNVSDVVLSIKSGVFDFIDANNMDLLAESLNKTSSGNVFSDSSKLNSFESNKIIYSISHDLKEPLRIIILYSQLIKKKFNKSIDNELNELLDFVTTSANVLNDLINALLTYSRAGNSKSNYTFFDSKQALEQAIEHLKEDIKKVNAVITFKGLPEIYGNTNEIVMVFEHLLANSIKFKSEINPSIEITCAENNNKFIFSFKDNGMGVKPLYFQEIFDIFKRLHNRSLYSGNGIGLSICKKIINCHEGEIWVESNHETESGITVFFSLPIILKRV
ncbi:MAG: PAS sensor, signal transduction histidine kinase [uncultured bacterium]|nr:MAG: PAS sensor, signal transduction histidine kinase [uncultured bacterium]